MNGRVYDPVVAGFLSPDPYVQMPFTRSGFNRYTYVMNNPLIFTDPSGYRPEALFEEEERLTRNSGNLGWDPFGWIMKGTSYMQQYIVDNSWSYNASSGTYINHETGQTINPITNYQDYLQMVEPHIDRTATVEIEKKGFCCNAGWNCLYAR